MVSNIVKYRFVLLALLVVITGVLSTGVSTAVIPDNSIRTWFLETDPQLKEYERFHKTFGNDEVILLHVQNPEGVVNREFLVDLSELSHTLEATEGVHKVISLLSAQDVFKTPEGLAFQDMEPEALPSTPELFERIQNQAVENPLLVDRLISQDGTQAMIWIQMEVMEDFDNRRDMFVDEVTEAVAVSLPGAEKSLGGIGVIFTALNKITQRDFGAFISLTYLLMFGALWWIFRSIRLVAATGGVITVGTLVMLGVYGLIGKQLNMVTVLLPTLVIVLGIADAIHFPACFLKELKKTPGDREGAIKRGLKTILLPCVMTTFTTMAGFLALSTSPMATVRELGIFAALGVGAALLASIVLMTCTFMGLKSDMQLPEHTRINAFLGLCGNLLRTHRPLLSVLFVAVMGISLYCAMNVKADTYTLGYLPDDHVVVQDHHSIVDTWGDYFPVEYTVEPREGLSAHSAEILNAMEAFEKKAIELPEVRNGFSLASLYRRTQDLSVAPAKASYEPFDAPLVNNLQSLMGSPDQQEWDKSAEAYSNNLFADLVTEKGDIARITFTGSMLSAAKLDAVLKQVDALAEQSFEGLGSVHATGYTPLYVRIVEYVLKSQTQAFFIALGLIFILMLAWLRSLRLAVLSLVVNALPVGVMLSAMYVLKLDLDIASATIAAIVLGVSIDDTIHFLYHWKLSEEAGMDWDECLDHTYQHAGVPAVMTTLLLLIGFPVLMLAQVKTVVFFGLLTTIAALAALLTDLFGLPLLLRAWPASR